MEYGCHKAKGLRATDSRPGVSLNKREAGPIKTMGYPCDMESKTPASKSVTGKNVPSDLDASIGSERFGHPKTRAY